MAIGHFLMASESLFFLALMFLILGNGCFKPNISTQVGQLYPPGDPRRDGAFTIFYMGINLGAFLSPLVCGTLGQKVGWHYGFGAAGVGMVLGLVLYLVGPEVPRARRARAAQGARAAPRRSSRMTREEWRRVWALVVLVRAQHRLLGRLRAAGQHACSSGPTSNTNWTFLGVDHPVDLVPGVQPVHDLPLRAAAHHVLGVAGERNQEPSSVTKMAIGCVLLGLSLHRHDRRRRRA